MRLLSLTRNAEPIFESLVWNISGLSIPDYCDLASGYQCRTSLSPVGVIQRGRSSVLPFVVTDFGTTPSRSIQTQLWYLSNVICQALSGTYTSSCSDTINHTHYAAVLISIFVLQARNEAKEEASQARNEPMGQGKEISVNYV